jgi:crotonobetainyl-CoA:carnitine CoA-transferase CaiB-like acyl-CoA transferase
MVQADSGLMAITGEVDGEPMKVGVAVVDVLAGTAAAAAILAALLDGGGRRIQISLADVARSALVNIAQNALVTGEEPRRHGNAHPSIVPYEVFAAADGPLAIGSANDGLYRRLCAALERPDLAEDARFATNPARVEHRDELVAELSRVFASRTADEWVERLEAAGVPVAKVRGVLEALAGHTFTVDHPTVGRLPLVPSPLGAATQPPPLLGEHTRDVLAEAGYDDDEIDALA